MTASSAYRGAYFEERQDVNKQIVGKPSVVWLLRLCNASCWFYVETLKWRSDNCATFV